MWGKRTGLHERLIVATTQQGRASRDRAHGYDALVLRPPDGENWLGLTPDRLPIGEIYEWCLRPECGAVVLFSGVVRDHADGRTDVVALSYEAYEEMVEPKLVEIAAEARRRWDGIGRIALVHRTGRLELSESSVVACVSAGHRPEAFAAARYAIDALKASVPIWKREEWSDGSDWGTGATHLVEPAAVPSAGSTEA